jgi:hypothetical protein
MKIKSVSFISLLSFTSIFLLSACSRKNKFDVDVSNIKVDIKINRLDVDLFKFNPDNSTADIKNLTAKYGDFFKLYTSKILNIGSPKDENFDQNLGKFLIYCQNEKIQQTVLKTFPQIDSVQDKLISAFQHYKYYFPKKEIPRIYTCISAFNESVITDSAVIGISLDKYLGTKCEYYKRLDWDNYLKRKMISAAIPVDAMRAWIQTEYPFFGSADNLLENMIYEGKIQYLLDAFLPSAADSVKWGCTEKQFEWAERNEKNIWTYLVEQKKIFSSQKSDIRNFISDGPFTVPFSKISMPRAGVRVGYKITEAYMERKGKISFEDLMKETDANKILTESRYNP